MPYQLSSVLHRLPGSWARVRAVPPRRGGGPAAAAGRTSDGVPDPRGTALDRLRAVTGSTRAADELAAVWDHLDGAARAAVVDPTGRLGRAGRQRTGTTCGAAALTMLAATGDPALALWLATGRLLDTYRPPELAAAPVHRLTALGSVSPERRFAPVHRVVLQQVTDRALLGLRWPPSLGTPPWGAARVARFAGVAFGHQVLDDTDPGHVAAVLGQVGAAVDRGVPVPLYSGGDTGRGWSTAVPRHVVLVVDRTPDGLLVWEPSSGRQEPVAWERLVAGGAPLPALGGWSHVTWAVLPVRTSVGVGRAPG